jgi:predicted HNH restriction endonuclease
MNQGLSSAGQALLELLVAHIQKPATKPDLPQTYLTYGQALDALGVTDDGSSGWTNGERLKNNGLNDLARWINQQGNLPKITGLIVIKGEWTPGKGYFKEYGRKDTDMDWWITEIRKSKAFDWSHYITLREFFSRQEVTLAGTFSEGAQSEATAKIRERSIYLRDLAREHFAKQSSDGRLRCSVCNWAPPTALKLSGPVVEIHHGLGISEYPKDGRALTFGEAIQHLTPLCPNCHRVVHAKPGGGVIALDELRSAMLSCALRP